MHLCKTKDKYEFLLSTIINGEEIYILLDKSCGKLLFYKLEQGKFVDPSKQTLLDLQRLFTSPDPRVQLFTMSNKINNDTKKLYTQIVSSCISNICHYTSTLPVDVQENIIKNFRNVKFITLEESPQFVKNTFKTIHFAGAFISSLNAVVVPSEKLFGNQNISYILQHELLHCATAGIKNNVEGFNETIVEPLNSLYKFGMVSMQSFNEAVTEHINNIMHDKQFGKRDINTSSRYDISRVAVGTLFKGADMKEINKFYFTSNVEQLSEFLCAHFHIQNVGLINRLYALFDVSTLSSLNQPSSHTFDSTVFDCYFALFQMIMDLTINKFVKENKSLKKLTLDYFIPKTTNFVGNKTYNKLASSKKLKQYLENAKLYAHNMYYNTEINTQCGYMEYRTGMIDVVKCMLFGQKLPEDEKYNKYKNFESLSQIVFNENFVCGKDFRSRINIKFCLKSILNSENNFLPKNLDKQQEIIQRFIFSPITKNISPFEYLSFEQVVKLGETNSDILAKICHENIDVLVANLDKLSNKVKLHSVFMKEFSSYEMHKPEHELISSLKMYCDSFAYEQKAQPSLRLRIESRLTTFFDQVTQEKLKMVIEGSNDDEMDLSYEEQLY